MGMDLNFDLERYNFNTRKWDFIDTEYYGRNSELYKMLKEFGYTNRKLPDDLSDITRSWVDDSNCYTYGWFTLYEFKIRLANTDHISRSGYLTPEQYHTLVQEDIEPNTWSIYPSDFTPINATWNTKDLHCLTSLMTLIDQCAKKHYADDQTLWNLTTRLIYILE